VASAGHVFLYRKSRIEFEGYLAHIWSCDGWRGFSGDLHILHIQEDKPMIKKVAGGYKVTSEKGKNLGGPYKSKAEAEKRLRQIEFFKHKKG
jgi:hypothetical protein